MSAGVRNPARNALISLVLLVASVGALGAGILAMTLAGAESAFSATAIALGGLGSIMFLATLINFVWAMRVFDAIRRGENVIARWTVPADAFDRFRKNEAGYVAAGNANDYKLPRHTPPEGVDVIFAADGVIVGDTFFGLATSGLSYFRQVWFVPGDPLSIGFQTVLVSGRSRSSVLGLLRIPVAGSAHPQATAVLDHYLAALAGRIVVRPDFWRRRIRWGLWAAVLFGIVSATGFGLAALDIDVGDLPLILAVSGLIAAIGGLVLAFLAWTFAARQRTK